MTGKVQKKIRLECLLNLFFSNHVVSVTSIYTDYHAVRELLNVDSFL